MKKVLNRKRGDTGKENKLPVPQSTSQTSPAASPFKRSAGRVRLLKSILQFKTMQRIPSSEGWDGVLSWDSREGIWCLPEDMLISIFKFLTPEDLQKVAQVIVFLFHFFFFW